jgi:hypothetical protein
MRASCSPLPQIEGELVPGGILAPQLADDLLAQRPQGRHGHAGGTLHVDAVTGHARPRLLVGRGSDARDYLVDRYHGHSP